MEIKTNYIWKNWKYIKWYEAMDHNLSHSLHYGTWVFEWIRLYSTKSWVKIFKLKEHIDRLFYSASILDLKIPFSKEEIIKAHIELVKKSWIDFWYIRPIVYYGTGKMWLNPQWAKIETVISVWNWWKYLADKAIDVKISKYKRTHPATADMNAKVSWWYYNNVLVNLEIKKEWFDEGLLLDTNWFIAEGPGENIFFVKDEKVYTPKKWTILPWITRDTIIELFKNELNINVIEEKINRDRLNDFDEAFFVWTSAEVTLIWTISFNNNKYLYTSEK